MQSEIDNILSRPPALDTEADLRSFVADVKQKIVAYERSLLEGGTYDEDADMRVNKWRKRMVQIISENRKKVARVGGGKHNDIFETFKLVSRQIDKADINLQLLDKSTLKLVGLDYSSKDIENEINKTKSILAKNRYEEVKEVRMLYLGLAVLLVVCLLILLDKLFIC